MNYLWSNINFPEKWILSVCQEIRISFFPSVVVTELSLCLYVGQTAWALKGRKTKSRGPKAEARSPGPQTSCWTIFLLELKMSRQSYFVFAKVCNVSPRLLSQYSPLSYFCFIILIFHWITKSFQLFPSTISCFSADFSMVENIILAGTHFMTQFGCFARGNHSSAWRTGGGGHGTLCYIGGGHGTLLHCGGHGTCVTLLVVDTVSRYMCSYTRGGHGGTLLHCWWWTLWTLWWTRYMWSYAGGGHGGTSLHCGHCDGHGTLVHCWWWTRYTVTVLLDWIQSVCTFKTSPWRHLSSFKIPTYSTSRQPFCCKLKSVHYRKNLTCNIWNTSFLAFLLFGFFTSSSSICTSHSVTLSLGRVSMLEYLQACFEPNTCGFRWKCVNRPKCRLGLCQGHCLMQITLELILPFSPSKQFFKAFDNPQLYQSCPCLWDENSVCVQHIECRIVIWGSKVHKRGFGGADVMISSLVAGGRQEQQLSWASVEPGSLPWRSSTKPSPALPVMEVNQSQCWSCWWCDETHYTYLGRPYPTGFMMLSDSKTWSFPWMVYSYSLKNCYKPFG